MGGSPNQERAFEALAPLIGQRCWNAMASLRADWVMVLDCGEKKRRSIRLANHRLSFLQRTFEGEYSMLIECVWRLDGPEGVVASCFDAHPPGVRPHAALSLLEGLQITEVAVEHAACDLTLGFSDGYVLRCLSTEVEPVAKRCNWALTSPQGLLTVGPRGTLVVESSRDAERRHEALKRKLVDAEDEPVLSLFDRSRRKAPPVDAEVTPAENDRGGRKAPPVDAEVTPAKNDRSRRKSPRAVDSEDAAPTIARPADAVPKNGATSRAKGRLRSLAGTQSTKGPARSGGGPNKSRRKR